MLDVRLEYNLQHELTELINELDIMRSFLRQQRDVIRRFIRSVEAILDPEQQNRIPSSEWHGKD